MINKYRKLNKELKPRVWKTPNRSVSVKALKVARIVGLTTKEYKERQNCMVSKFN